MLFRLLANANKTHVELQTNLDKTASSLWLCCFQTSAPCFDIRSRFSSLMSWCCSKRWDFWTACFQAVSSFRLFADGVSSPYRDISSGVGGFPALTRSYSLASIGWFSCCCIYICGSLPIVNLISSSSFYLTIFNGRTSEIYSQFFQTRSFSQAQWWKSPPLEAASRSSTGSSKINSSYLG